MQKIIFTTAGIISLTLGIVGIVVPLLPTTPFLLLASACFLRGSRRLHTWLIQNQVFGNYILAYQRFHAVSKRTKILSLILLWVSILTSSVLFVSLWWVRIVLIAIATGVTIHIVYLKNLTSEMVKMLKMERPSAHPPLQQEEKQDRRE